MTLPVARDDKILSYALRASSNLYTESITGFTEPVGAWGYQTIEKGTFQGHTIRDHPLQSLEIALLVLQKENAVVKEDKPRTTSYSHQS